MTKVTPPFDPTKPLKNEKREKFANLIVAGQSLEEAHHMAGLSPDRRNADRTRRHPQVDARIKWLVSVRKVETAQHIEEAKQTVDAKIDATLQGVLNALVENLEIAMGKRTVKERIIVRSRKKGEAPRVVEIECTKFSGLVANQAITLLGKELGMWQTPPGSGDDAPAHDSPLTTMSDEEKYLYAAQRLGPRALAIAHRLLNEPKLLNPPPRSDDAS